MLGQPGMVRGGLNRVVERDLEPELLRPGDHAVEVLEAAELGMDRVVTALRPADRPRRAGIARARIERVVGPLAIRPADRVDRRQVDDVEAELRQLRQHPLDPGEAAERAREELVPGAEARELAVDLDGVELAPRRVVPIRGGRGERGLDVELRDPEQLLALGQLAAQVLLAGLDLAPQLVAPGRGAVAPRLDEVLPAAAAGDGERAGEDVVAGRLERRRLEAALAGLAVEDAGAEDVVPVAEHARGDVDALAHRPFDGEAAAVELGPNGLDTNPRQRFSERFHGHGG